MANAEVAQKVLDHVLMYPEQHNQARYFLHTDCGTTACVAGWAAILSGRVDLDLAKTDELSLSDTRLYGSYTWFREGKNALGLTQEEAEWLFISTNNEQSVLALKRIANGEPVIEREFE